MQLIDENELQKIYSLINHLNYESEKGAIVLVEGKRDKEALNLLGYKGSIMIFNNFRGINNIIKHLEGKSKVILLFDMDRKGKELTKRISSLIHNTDLLYKRRLISITKGKITHIEELVIYTKTLYSQYIYPKDY